MPHTPAKQWAILTGLTLGVCVIHGFSRIAYGLILPAMKQDLGWSYAEAGWINTANALGYMLGAFLTFALVKRLSSSRLFGLGMLGTSVFLLATGFSENLIVQTFLRILTGLFGAMAFVTGGTLSAGLFEHNPRHNALAITIYFGIGGGLGIVLSGAILPAMFAHYGATAWPMAWMLLGAASLALYPFNFWAAENLRPKIAAPATRSRLPVSKIRAELAAYTCFGIGYIVYPTFIVAWIQEQAASPAIVSLVWVIVGLGIMASPFAWRRVFAKHAASGLPMSMVLLVMALGTIIPVIVSSLAGWLVSAALFGLSVFMAPGAVTSFSQRNLPKALWAAAISLSTILFSIGQTIGPIAAGMLGDALHDIGPAIAAAAGILLLGAAIAWRQKPLNPDEEP